MKKRFIKYFSIGLVSLVSLTSCQGLFNLDSDQVLFADDNKLDTPYDTVYSVIGIVSQLQKIADRTVLLGSIRGDLVSLTQYANTDLQDLANFSADINNEYNVPSDYYAIINSCNYFIANADTSLKKKNKAVFIKEFAAVKAIRAWTYLQLAQIYGSVPFVTDPILSEKEAELTYEKKDIEAICTYFIEDIKPYINTELPGYGSISDVSSSLFYFPIRLLLGDMCLWTGRYLEAATYYHDYLANSSDPHPIGYNFIGWSTSTVEFESTLDAYYSIFSNSGSADGNTISIIPFEDNEFDGVVSDLNNIFSSTTDNEYYYKATYSNALYNLSRSQTNCKIFVNETALTKDTLYSPSDDPEYPLLVGDLRLYSIYDKQTVSVSSLSSYSSDYQRIYKYPTTISQLVTNRVANVYLRYAEALNRAGFPTAAFAVLKYGLTADNIATYVDTLERQKAAGTTLLTWDNNNFIPVTMTTSGSTTVISGNTQGLHSRGSGNAAADTNYVIPAGVDTIEFVENKICDEMALELSFEGYRFFDLIRLAKHKTMPGQDGPAFLATKVASREGALDASLYNALLTESNWYLPLE